MTELTQRQWEESRDCHWSGGWEAQQDSGGLLVFKLLLHISSQQMYLEGAPGAQTRQLSDLQWHCGGTNISGSFASRCRQSELYGAHRWECRHGQAIL